MYRLGRGRQKVMKAPDSANSGAMVNGKEGGTSMPTSGGDGDSRRGPVGWEALYAEGRQAHARGSLRGAEAERRSMDADRRSHILM